MKRILVTLVSFLVCINAFAYTASIRKIAITVDLAADGSAYVEEEWDVTVASGTEWYLVKSNLGDIIISDLSVTDESGTRFQYVGDWDVDWSMTEKTSKCGLIRKADGGEICWGVGSYGDHRYSVKYKLENIVKSLRDFDMLHFQFVSPGLSTVPEDVSVRISGPEDFDLATCAVWGFGYDGAVELVDGDLVLRADDSYGRNSSVIALMRFDKGLFHSASVQDRSFQEVLDRALEGHSYLDGEENSMSPIIALLCFVGALVLIVILVVVVVSYNYKSILGMKRKEVGWSREVPFDGDIVAADHVLTMLGETRKQNSAASAMILRMIQKSILLVRKDAKGNVEIVFNDDADMSILGSSEHMLYDMMKEASGSDMVLQNREFSRWSSRHSNKLRKWVMSLAKEGQSRLRDKKYMVGLKMTPEGQAKARGLYGFKKYLKDFTLSEEKQSVEVILWQDYLVFAALFGIADKVAKELRDINPQAFDEMMMTDYVTMHIVLFMTRSLADSITNASVASSTALGGGGGMASFGGGGGFSGGGFGGGSR